MKLHILGIAGTFMGGVAALARELGHAVEGSDQAVYPPMSTQLEQLGIILDQGYRADSVPAGTDEAELCRRAAAEGIFVAPGAVFYPQRSDRHPPALRINVAHGADPRFLDFLAGAIGSARATPSNR